MGWNIGHYIHCLCLCSYTSALHSTAKLLSSKVLSHAQTLLQQVCTALLASFFPLPTAFCKPQLLKTVHMMSKILIEYCILAAPIWKLLRKLLQYLNSFEGLPQQVPKNPPVDTNLQELVELLQLVIFNLHLLDKSDRFLQDG
jgi:hypothetical protein